MSAKRRLCWLTLASALVLPAVSEAASFAQSELAKLRVHRLRAVQVRGDPDIWHFDVLVSGTGEAALVLESVQAEPFPIDELEHTTGPRFVELGPWNPCEEGGPPVFGRIYAPSEVFPWPQGPLLHRAQWPKRSDPELPTVVHRFETAALARTFLLEKNLQGRFPSKGPVSIAMFSLTSTKTRLGGTAQLNPSQSLTLHRFLPRSKNQRVDLYSMSSPGHAAFGVSGAADMANRFSVPEVAFEYPFDTEAAILRNTQRTSGAPAVRVFSGRIRFRGQVVQVNRYGLETLFANGALPQLKPLFETIRLGVDYHVHRPFRGPIECGRKSSYLLEVAKEQAAEHQLLSASTGRPKSALIDLSLERGYLLDPSDENPLKPVRVDTSRWR